jgi:hypothetical protein
MARQQFLSYGKVEKKAGLLVAFMALSCLLFAPLSAWATIGQWRWHGIGLAGETVRAVVLDPTNSATIYAGTEQNGVYKSTDGGGSWSKANIGLTNMSIMALTIDPTTPSIVYAGTFGGGVFKSTNSCGTWSPVFADYMVTDFVLGTSSNLYAGVLTVGVYKSIDSGASWNASSTGMASPYIWSLAIDPATPTTLYAGTVNSGVQKSINGGASWNAVNSGLPSPFPSIWSMAVDPTTPTTLYAGTQQSGVYKSSNGGATWNDVTTSLTPMDVSKIAIDPTTSHTLYAGTVGSGVFKSIDAGATWNSDTTTLTNLNIRSLAITRTTPVNTLYAGTDDGLFVWFQQPADTVPPTGAITINGNAGYTPTASVSLTLSATDTVGVTAYYLSTASTQPTAGSVGWIAVKESSSYLADVPYMLLGSDGVNTVHVWYKDSEGNVSTMGSASISLDTTPPVDGTLVSNPMNSQVVLSWSDYRDPVSGISTYTLVYSLGSEPTSCTMGAQLYSGTATSFTHTNLTNATTYYYRLCATDNVGNISSGLVASATPDGTAPAGKISFNGGVSVTSNRKVNIDLFATDNVGVTGYFQSESPTPPTSGGTGWSTVATTSTFSATVPFMLSNGDGIKSVYVWYKDAVGNVSTSAASQITLDTVPPSDGLLTATPGDTQLTLSWSGFSDAGSGIVGYTLVYSAGSVPLSCASGIPVYTGVDTSFIHTGLPNGIRYYYRVCATDAAGYSSVGATSSAMTVTLNAAVSGSGSGSVHSVTPGISFACNLGACSAIFTADTALTLRPTPDGSSFFTGWSGDCTGKGDCLLPMANDSSVTATFDVASKVKVGVNYFNTLQLAYEDFATTNNSVLKLLGGTHLDSFNAGRSITVILEGGYNGDFSVANGATILSGPIVISAGTVEMATITIR